MSFIEMALGEAKEKEVVPEGQYTLIVEDAELIEEDGRGRVLVRLSIDGMPNAKSVFHSISLTSPEDDPEKRNTKLLFAKAFCEAFDISFEANGFALEDFPGSRGEVHLIQDEYKGVVNNRIKLRV